MVQQYCAHVMQANLLMTAGRTSAQMLLAVLVLTLMGLTVDLLYLFLLCTLVMRCHWNQVELSCVQPSLSAWQGWCALQVLPKGYGGQAEMIPLQDYVRMHILPKQQVRDMCHLTC